jgi:hypothetical protein
VAACGIAYFLGGVVLELTSERTLRRGNVGPSRRLGRNGRVLRENPISGSPTMAMSALYHSPC